MFDELTETDDDACCVEQHEQVLAYLLDEGFKSPSVSDWPAWHVAPLISVWALESSDHPGQVGWWVVSGDFPTDYTTCQGDRHPRQGLRDIGLRWREAALRWAEGKPADGWNLRDSDKEMELAPLLAARAKLFLDIAADDSNWIE